MNKDAIKLRKLLTDMGLSQTEAARELGITDRMMRYYVAGDKPIPKLVWLALASINHPSRGKP